MHCMSAQVEGLHRFTKLLYRMSKRSRHKSHPGNHGRCQTKTAAIVSLFAAPKMESRFEMTLFGVYVSPKRNQLTCQHAHQGLKLFLNEPGTNQGKIGTQICDKKCGPCLILARKDWMASQAHLHPDIANMIAWTGPELEPWTAAQPTKQDNGRENNMKMVCAAIASQIFRKCIRLPRILEIARIYLDLQATTSLGDPCSRLEPSLKSKGKISDSAGLSRALGSIWAQHETIPIIFQFKV